MSWLTNARNYAAFGLSIPGYVRRFKALSVEEAQAAVRLRLETREQRFLEVVDRFIFGNAASPYLPLLSAAGCELEDIRKLVQSDGLEGTLVSLRKEGVFFTFEEFKGRTPVQRSNVSFDVRPDDFANPTLKRHILTQTSGSTGPPTRSWTSLQSRGTWQYTQLPGLAAHGLLGVPSARFSPAEPSNIAGSLLRAKTAPYEKWFAPSGRRTPKQAFSRGVARRLIALAGRVGGVKSPKIHWVDPGDGLPIARWAEETLRTNDRCLIMSGAVSNAVRIALAALENDIDLTGATIMGGAEPPTPAKVRTITRTGAKWFPRYMFSEGGSAGTGCANPVDGTDVHFLADRLALIQHPRQVPGSDLVVDAFNFTSLTQNARSILLNVEIDDFGILERRSCGCGLEELGYDLHLREIYSYRKLTSEGQTLIGSNMIHILEEVLPSRFGGSPLDYQLVEKEDEDGLTRLSLVIHPRVKIDDEALVVRTVLEELRSTSRGSSMMGTILAQSGTFLVERLEPISTGSRGKLLPLHLSQRSRARS